MKQVIIRSSRVKMVMVFLGSVALSVVSGWLAFGDPSRYMSGWSTIFFCFTLVFFSAPAVYTLYRAIKPKPALVLTEEGLLDNASLINAGFLSWDEMVEVAVYSLSGQQFIGITVRDPDALLLRVSPARRFWLRMNRYMGMPLVNIPKTALSDPIDEVAELIREFRQRCLDGSA